MATTKRKNTGEVDRFTTNGKTEEDIQLELKGGENTFKIIVTDTDGEIKEFEEMYEIKSDANIEFSLKDNKVNISISSKTEISYVTYRWNEEEEERVIRFRF